MHSNNSRTVGLDSAWAVVVRVVSLEQTREETPARPVLAALCSTHSPAHRDTVRWWPAWSSSSSLYSVSATGALSPPLALVAAVVLYNEFNAPLQIINTT